MRKLLFFLILFLASNANSAELSAEQLQEHCNETEKGIAGENFNAQKSEICKGYMMGFFDSMIIVDQLTQKPQICMPLALPRTQNNLILNNWVKQNKKIAATTTAAVALFAAYSKSFPCK